MLQQRVEHVDNRTNMNIMSELQLKCVITCYRLGNICTALLLFGNCTSLHVHVGVLQNDDTPLTLIGRCSVLVPPHVGYNWTNSSNLDVHHLVFCITIG